MVDFDILIQQLEQSGHDVFWQGPASDVSIRKLEQLVDSKLPMSLKSFLASCGGGGVVGEEISGIENDDPRLEYRGTVYGDTLLCRENYGLPETLIVVYLGADDVVWCLDVNQFTEGECPVVSFNVMSKKTSLLSASFSDFLAEYLTLRIA